MDRSRKRKRFVGESSGSSSTDNSDTNRQITKTNSAETRNRPKPKLKEAPQKASHVCKVGSSQSSSGDRGKKRARKQTNILEMESRKSSENRISARSRSASTSDSYSSTSTGSAKKVWNKDTSKGVAENAQLSGIKAQMHSPSKPESASTKTSTRNQMEDGSGISIESDTDVKLRRSSRKDKNSSNRVPAAASPNVDSSSSSNSKPASNATPTSNLESKDVSRSSSKKRELHNLKDVWSSSVSPFRTRSQNEGSTPTRNARRQIEFTKSTKPKTFDQRDQISSLSTSSTSESQPGSNKSCPRNISRTSSGSSETTGSFSSSSTSTDSTSCSKPQQSEDRATTLGKGSVCLKEVKDGSQVSETSLEGVLAEPVSSLHSNMSSDLQSSSGGSMSGAARSTSDDSSTIKGSVSTFSSIKESDGSPTGFSAFNSSDEDSCVNAKREHIFPPITPRHALGRKVNKDTRHDGYVPEYDHDTSTDDPNDHCLMPLTMNDSAQFGMNQCEDDGYVQDEVANATNVIEQQNIFMIEHDYFNKEACWFPESVESIEASDIPNDIQCQPLLDGGCADTKISLVNTYGLADSENLNSVDSLQWAINTDISSSSVSMSLGVAEVCSQTSEHAGNMAADGPSTKSDEENNLGFDVNDFVIRRRRLRSESSQDELWEGIPAVRPFKKNSSKLKDKSDADSQENVTSGVVEISSDPSITSYDSLKAEASSSVTGIISEIDSILTDTSSLQGQAESSSQSSFVIVEGKPSDSKLVTETVLQLLDDDLRTLNDASLSDPEFESYEVLPISDNRAASTRTAIDVSRLNETPDCSKNIVESSVNIENGLSSDSSHTTCIDGDKNVHHFDESCKVSRGFSPTIVNDLDPYEQSSASDACNENIDEPSLRNDIESSDKCSNVHSTTSSKQMKLEENPCKRSKGSFSSSKTETLGAPSTPFASHPESVWWSDNSEGWASSAESPLAISPAASVKIAQGQTSTEDVNSTDVRPLKRTRSSLEDSCAAMDEFMFLEKAKKKIKRLSAAEGSSCSSSTASDRLVIDEDTVSHHAGVVCTGGFTVEESDNATEQEGMHKVSGDTRDGTSSSTASASSSASNDLLLWSKKSNKRKLSFPRIVLRKCKDSTKPKPKQLLNQTESQEAKAAQYQESKTDGVRQAPDTPKRSARLRKRSDSSSASNSKSTDYFFTSSKRDEKKTKSSPEKDFHQTRSSVEKAASSSSSNVKKDARHDIRKERTRQTDNRDGREKNVNDNNAPRGRQKKKANASQLKCRKESLTKKPDKLDEQIKPVPPSPRSQAWKRKRAPLVDQELLTNPVVDKHACVLWSSEKRRHLQLSHPNATSAELDDMLRNQWTQNLTDQEKMKYFTRARDALKDEDKHTGRSRDLKRTRGSETEKVRKVADEMTTLEQFMRLKTKRQKDLLTKWLHFFQKVLSRKEYAEFIENVKQEILEVETHEKPNKTRGLTSKIFSHKKLLFLQMHKLKDHVLAKYCRRKERQKELHRLAYRILITRLIQGKPCSFIKGCRSKKLTQVLQDLKELEYSDSLAVLGYPIARSSFTDLYREIVETVDSCMFQDKPSEEDSVNQEPSVETASDEKPIESSASTSGGNLGSLSTSDDITGSASISSETMCSSSTSGDALSSASTSGDAVSSASTSGDNLGSASTSGDTVCFDQTAQDLTSDKNVKVDDIASSSSGEPNETINVNIQAPQDVEWYDKPIDQAAVDAILDELQTVTDLHPLHPSTIDSVFLPPPFWIPYNSNMYQTLSTGTTLSHMTRPMLSGPQYPQQSNNKFRPPGNIVSVSNSLPGMYTTPRGMKPTLRQPGSQTFFLRKPYTGCAIPTRSEYTFETLTRNLPLPVRYIPSATVSMAQEPRSRMTNVPRTMTPVHPHESYQTDVRSYPAPSTSSGVTNNPAHSSRSVLYNEANDAFQRAYTHTDESCCEMDSPSCVLSTWLAADKTAKDNNK